MLAGRFTLRPDHPIGTTAPSDEDLIEPSLHTASQSMLQHAQQSNPSLHFVVTGPHRRIQVNMDRSRRNRARFDPHAYADAELQRMEEAQRRRREESKRSRELCEVQRRRESEPPPPEPTAASAEPVADGNTELQQRIEVTEEGRRDEGNKSLTCMPPSAPSKPSKPAAEADEGVSSTDASCSSLHPPRRDETHARGECERERGSITEQTKAIEAAGGDEDEPTEDDGSLSNLPVRPPGVTRKTFDAFINLPSTDPECHRVDDRKFSE